MTLTSWTINASIILIVVWMQRHDRWHTFALAVRGNYGIKNGSYKGSQHPYEGLGSAVAALPTISKTVASTIATSVQHPSKIFVTGPKAVWTDIKNLF